jgi:hypothetical protein
MVFRMVFLGNERSTLFAAWKGVKRRHAREKMRLFRAFSYYNDTYQGSLYMDIKLGRLRLALASAAILTIAGCGGSNSSSGGTPSDGIPSGGTSTTISGTAAVGAPLAGTVTVKDALGVSRTSDIGVNGAYLVDVSGLTAPFVFRAEGRANGQTYIVHSIATAADAGGKINITQLTDLIVANIAGQIAQNYFDKFEQDGNSGSASKAAVDAEVSKLKEKLMPVLAALGVDAAVDLLRTPFTPLASALDKALDAIHVSVDSNTNIATISTLVNQITISDDLRTKAAAETNPPQLSDANVATGLADADLVKKVLTNFSDKFATGLPVASELTQFLTPGFRSDDGDSTGFLDFATTESNLVGGAFTDINIHYIDYSDATRITARVSFTVMTRNGIELGRLENWRVRKGSDNVWRLHGDQRVLSLEGFAGMNKSISSLQSCVGTGLNFNIQNFDTNNDGGAIDHILVTGPGLPGGGLRYVPDTGGRWKISGSVPAMTNYQMANSCASVQTVSDATIAAIPDNAIYTVTAYDSADVKINFPTGTSNGTYGIKIQRRPMTLAEVSASTAAFPTIASPTVSEFSSFASGALSVVGNNVNPTKSSWIHLTQKTALNDFSREVEVTAIPTANGAVSASLSLAPLATGDSITSRMLSIESPDAYRRNMYTAYHLQ